MLATVMNVSCNRSLKKSLSTSSISSMRISVSPPKDPANPLEKVNERIEDLFQIISDRDETIRSLLKRVINLEQQNEIVKSKEFVKDRVIDELRAEIDRQQMYTRRYSVNIAGIEKKKGENHGDLKREVVDIINAVDSGVSESDIDKFHRDGPQNGSEQDIIVRFKTHSAKERFYMKRKTLNRRGVKIRPSLSKQRKQLLNQANDILETYQYKDSENPMYNPPEFVYANMHGDILVKMAIKSKKGLFIKIKSIEQMSLAIAEAQFVKDSSMKKYEDKYFKKYDDSYDDDFLGNISDDSDSCANFSLR